MKDPKVIAERIVAAAGEHSGAKGGVRSPLYGLLWDQYDALAPALNPPRTPNWEAVAREVTEGGVLDGKGQHPKAATVQKTWAKVVRDKGHAAEGAIPPKRRRRKPGDADMPPPASPQPATRDATPAPAPDVPADTADEDEIVPRFAGGPKKWNRGGPESG